MDLESVGGVSPEQWLAFGSLLIFTIVTAFTKAETRSYLALVAALLLVPSPVTPLVMCVLQLVPGWARAVKEMM